jgi:aspartyl-tRNA(Asn)/glutamyl-tRNA(Gln) amidotransferase subunit A
MAEAYTLSVAEAALEIRSGALSPLELTQACLERISRLDGRLRSYVTVTADLALERAREATELIARGKYLGPLHGIPVSVKDTIATAGVRTTAASPLYQNWVPKVDAGVVAALKRAGAVVLGKAMCSELGFVGPATARNPWNVQYEAGASSSGSVAGVAASLCSGSIGSDSGGSIRNPAALCGVTGLKPTLGRISRAHCVPLSHSFDTIGPIARSAEDCALMLDALSGYDREDPISLKLPTPQTAAQLSGSVAGTRIGIPSSYIEAFGMSAEVARAFHAAVDVFRSAGATINDVNIAFGRHARAVNWLIMRCEGFNVHRRMLKERRSQFSPGSYRALAVAEYLTADDYLCAQQARTLLARELEDVFGRIDVLVLPTRPTTAQGGEIIQQPRSPEEAVPKAAVNYVSLFNVSGGPAISLPCGFDAAGLPIGLQIAGKALDEATVIRVADAYQRLTSWHRRRPTVS